MKRVKVHFQGCLIGGAIGDAPGWPIERISRCCGATNTLLIEPPSRFQKAGVMQGEPKAIPAGCF